MSPGSRVANRSESSAHQISQTGIPTSSTTSGNSRVGSSRNAAYRWASWWWTPMNGTSHASANALAAALSGARVSLVLATPLKRTQQTGRPTAEAQGVKVQAIALDGGVNIMA